MKTTQVCLAVISLQSCLCLSGCGASAPPTEAEFKHTSSIKSLAISPNGKYLAAGGSLGAAGNERWEGKLIVWEIATKKEVASHSLPQWVQGVGFSNDGKMLAAGIGCPYSSNPEIEGLKKKPGEIRIYDTEKFQEMTNITESDGVHSVRFSPDSEWLASASSVFHQSGQPVAPGAVKIWKVGTWKESFCVPNLKDTKPGIAFHPDKNYLAVTDAGTVNAGPGKMKMLDISTQRVFREFSIQKYSMFFVEFSPKGRFVAVLAANGEAVVLWDWESGKDVTPLALPKELDKNHPIVALSPDGKFLAGTENISYKAGRNKTPWIKIWDLEKQKAHAQWNWESKGDQVTCLTFSPDSQSLAVGSSTGAIKMFRVPD